MKIHIGIPARMGSSRFPGKPLKKILGKSMIEHVYRRSMLAKNIDNVFVATCDTEIMDTVRKFGGKAYMTDKDIMRPGLRVASSCEQINMNDDDIVVVAFLLFLGREELVVDGPRERLRRAVVEQPSMGPSRYSASVSSLEEPRGIICSRIIQMSQLCRCSYSE